MATGISRDQRLVPTRATVVISPHSLQAARWPSLSRCARVEGRATSIGVVCERATLAHIQIATQRRAGDLEQIPVVTDRGWVVRFVASGDTATMDSAGVERDEVSATADGESPTG